MSASPPSTRTKTLTSFWIGWRTRFGWSWLETLVLASYTTVLGLTIPYHEPWMDEAQSWCIARDNSVWEILRYRLHYEGAPGLWHLILHAFQRLGGRYGGIDYLSAAFAVMGIAVFLRWSPFPLLLRVLLPFTFFLQYQYAVIARGYVLIPLLLFGLCVLFPRHHRSGWLFALLAGLLANISLHGAVCAFVLVGLWVWQHGFTRRERGLSSVRARLRPMAGPLALFAGLLLVAGLTAMPAPDTSFAIGGVPPDAGVTYTVVSRFPGPLPSSEWPPTPPKIAEKAAQSGPPDPIYGVERPFQWASFSRHPGVWSAWYIHRNEWDAQNHFHEPPFRQTALKVGIELLTLATAPMMAFWGVLPLAFLAVLGVWLWRRGVLLMMLPWAATLVVMEGLWVADHHIGLLFVILLAVVWLGYDAPQPNPASGRRRQSQQLLDRILVCLLAAICAVQIVWTVVTVRNERHSSYDPGRETAEFLKQGGFRHMASFDFIAGDVQPYFEQNPFYNLRRSYWVWALGHNSNDSFRATIAQHPDAVLFSQDVFGSGLAHDDWAPLSMPRTGPDVEHNPIIFYLMANGYRETHRFCGDRFFRLGYSYRACNLIYEPVAEPLSQKPAVPMKPPSGS